MSRFRVALAALVGLAVLFTLWAAVDLVRVERDVDRGVRLLKSAGAADVAEANGLARVAQSAQRRFVRADRRARTSWPLSIVSPIPVVGHQVRAIRSMARTTREVGAIGADAATALQPRLDGASDRPSARVALLEAAVLEIRTVRQRLRSVELPDHRWVLPPVRGTRKELLTSLEGARAKMRDALVMTSALHRMFVGPSRYLILAANNAEMRAGGMPLSAGVVELIDGEIKLGEFKQTGDLFLGTPVSIPKNLHEMYGWLSIGAEWRATTVTPNFPASAAMYAQMAPRSGLGEVDGVMLVDVLALRAVMAVTGPVTVDDRTYTHDNVAREVMNENYIRFPLRTPRNQRRRALLQGELARGVFDAMNTRPLKVGPLVASLSAAGEGRHLLAWSKDKSLRMVWQRAGIDGRLNPNGLMVNLENITANKLDWHIKPKVELRTLSVRRGIRRVELKVTVANKRRTRTSEIVEGAEYTRSHGLADGEHRVYFVAYLPKVATNISSFDPPFETTGVDGGMNVVGFRYGVKVDSLQTTRVEFSLPKDQTLLLIPSARAHPVEVTVGQRTYPDDRPRRIKF